MKTIKNSKSVRARARKRKSTILILICVLCTATITSIAVLAQGSIIEPEGAIAELWVARYSGPGNFYKHDRARALALDSLGNVYVTGYSYSATGYYDYATVKYDADGTQLWVARYDGPGIGNDYACALAVDSSGNVYVTGESEADYATVKYDTNGNEKWVARYDGPANNWDSAHALAVDSSGNVYVTGESYGLAYDYATIKYDTDGNQLWIARYDLCDDRANALAIDSSGNVYVTGYSYGSMTSCDYATVKYDSDGNQLWVARYGGPGTVYHNIATELAVDISGNVYVSGRKWTFDVSNPDYATVKYDLNGNQLWDAMYDGPANREEIVSGLAVDSLGNVYVTGTSRGSEGNMDYATVKYDSDGNQLWVARYDGPGIGSDGAYALALDSSDNVYVAGGSYGGLATRSDYTIVIYDSDGNEKCVARYDGPVSRYDNAIAIAVDSSGNIYVTGESVGSGYDWDYATVKYGLFIPDSVSIGDNVQLGQFVSIGEDVIIGDDVVIGDWVVIHENVEIEDGAQIGEDVIIEEDVTIGEDVIIGNGVEIGWGTVIKDGAQIGSNVIIGENVKIGKDAIIGENSKIGDNVHIGNGQVVPPGSTIP